MSQKDVTDLIHKGYQTGIRMVWWVSKPRSKKPLVCCIYVPESA